jgi:pyruvate dehydrogenase E1 component
LGFNNIEEQNRILEEIQNRVLWLSVKMVDYANHVRPNPSGVKIGGHQASSASVVTLLTYLYFEYMTAGDRLSLKPHASPVYHAIQLLLGNLDPEYLTKLREFHGLQAYPSRTKDPDGVDFSSGSVGLGAVAPNFASLTEEYIRTHFSPESGVNRKYISLLGDAELDEGSVWEAISEPELKKMRNVLWIVDLNRQSLDRIIPGMRVSAWRDMFVANGWNYLEAKYGTRLQAAFDQPNGHLLRHSIDDMSNDVYQRLLRVNASTLRDWLPRTSEFPEDLSNLIDQWDDNELQSLFRNLGGHDFSMLRHLFSQLDLESGPTVLFAYTLKGWNLPSVGDPQNHSVILNNHQMDLFKTSLGVDDDEIMFKSDTDAGKVCSTVGSSLRDIPTLDARGTDVEIPEGFGRNYNGQMSTQQIFGLILTDISRNIPEVSERVISLSPDVASSTNLGGWINKVGVWGRPIPDTMPEEDTVRALQWIESESGQHLELGISENNLFMALGQLGLSYEMTGELLFPIGTLYDPFIRRGLDAFLYGLYSGAKFMVVGTPSGLTLGPEGGSHQSMITPSIGVELPDLLFYEPCFGQELEWITMASLANIRNREKSTYLRLTSKRVDQSIFKVPDDPRSLSKLRSQVLAGAYKLIDRSKSAGFGQGYNVVNIVACGAVVPEAVDASNRLLAEGVYANVISVTGPGPLYQRFQNTIASSIESGRPPEQFMAEVIDISERSAPIVTVVDGHPHSLAWIGAAMKTLTFPLGVTSFGQSGTPPELYKEYGIDSETIMSACFSSLGM